MSLTLEQIKELFVEGRKIRIQPLPEDLNLKRLKIRLVVKVSRMYNNDVDKVSEVTGINKCEISYYLHKFNKNNDYSNKRRKPI